MSYVPMKNIDKTHPAFNKAPYRIIDQVSITNIADARDRLRREGCTSSFVRNAAEQMFEVYHHPDGRKFAALSAFKSKRGIDMVYTIAEVVID